MNRTALGFAVVAVLVVASVACGQSVPALVAEAEALLPVRYERPNLEAAIRLYEQTLAQEPGNPAYLARLAQLWYEWAVLVPLELEEQGWRKAAEFGFQALGLSGLAAVQGLSDAAFRQFLAAATDAAPILWAAHGWGQLLGTMNPFAAFGSLPKIRAMYERVIELDPAYHGGSGPQAYGALLANLSDWGILFGVKLADAKAQFERAMTLDPSYLENYVAYAKEYAVRAKNRALFEQLLGHVLATPIGDWPFWNRHAKDKAAQYLAQASAWFR
ncbi:MAG: TRAP transporter TatT component family protein [Candidatus Bipolaricaulota bacterium]